MNAFCHSCGTPLTKGQPARGHYCQYCSDEAGNLHPRKLVQKGIAEWLQSWAPDGSTADFMERAALYMQAMPAWAGR